MLTSTHKTSKISELLESEETYATTLLTIIVDNYSFEALEWEPNILTEELENDFGVTLARVNIDKIQSLATCILTDRFYNDWLFFNVTCNALNHEEVDFQNPSEPTPEEVAWALTEVMLFEDPDDRPDLTPEIQTYIGVVLANHGVVKPPDVLKAATLQETEQQALNNMGDDPALVNGWYEIQNQNAKSITDYLKSNLTELIQELDNLPLQFRDEDSWTKYKERAMSKLNTL